MKNMFRKFGLPVLAVGLLSVVFYACSKDNSVGGRDETIPANKQKISIYLTDDPGLFDKVNVDIKAVEVLVDTCMKDNGDNDRWGNDDRCGWDDGRREDECKVWDTLAIRPGVYDLLTLRNGVDTLFANGPAHKGYIIKIRITIGNNNSLVKNDVTYPVKTITGQSKLIVKVRHSEWEEYTTDQMRLWLDFDVKRSIVEVKRGTFVLKPYILVWTMKQTGSLSGKVSPRDAYSILSVYNGNDTMYALPGWDGYYKVRGLRAGDYNIFVNPSNGYNDTTLTGIKVEAGKETKVPTITLKK
ncbi:uncharacterized protein DUF4382 [Chitinophaga skermanii]|uniref:Uncharacterized protein DUF4382 n=1 Tax=Chitinophaga skermanii TaxID=331697 RepID=A0A327QM55_9BACT|nr:DUF4382 domain-containing protein [Chitinophaga skermanii]RAJ05341.1 uncharacterized protein DUF4382 [Chitinophaga skermanii]